MHTPIYRICPKAHTHTLKVQCARVRGIMWGGTKSGEGEWSKQKRQQRKLMKGFRIGVKKHVQYSAWIQGTYSSWASRSVIPPLPPTHPFFFHFVLLTRAGHYIDIYLNHYIVIREVSSPAFKGLHYSKAMQYYYFTCSNTPLYPLSHHIQLRVIIYNKCHCVNIL